MTRTVSSHSAASASSTGTLAPNDSNAGRLGILSAASLQCILQRSSVSTTSNASSASYTVSNNINNSSYGKSAKHHATADNACSPYDPRFAFAPATSVATLCNSSRAQLQLPHAKRPTESLKRKRRSTKCLQPMAMAIVSPLSRASNDTRPGNGNNSSKHASTRSALAAGTATATAETTKPRPTPVRNQLGSARDAPTIAASTSASDATASLSAQKRSAKLASEIAWIHTHLPVLQLATTQCSRALRQQLFASTIVSNFSRAVLRQQWQRWRSVVAAEKRLALRKLCASTRLIDLLQDASVDRVRRRFSVWKRYVRVCQSHERLAACVTIQHWLRQQRQRQEADVAAAHTLHLHRVLDRMHASARLIQRALQTYALVCRFQRSRRAAQCIQRSVRTHQHHVRTQLSDSAARTIQRTLRRFTTTAHASLAALVAQLVHRHAACVLQRHWRAYATWKHTQLPQQCIASLVDRVEYNSAIAAIQRHAVGFLCRHRLKRCRTAATTVQHCWQRYIERARARQTRCMLQLQRTSAACCLQRTFRRKCEREQFQRVLKASTQPLYLRACRLSASFRVRYSIPIAKSAVWVIESAWHKHTVYVAWRARRLTAATRLQMWWRKAWPLIRWHTIVAQTLEHDRYERCRHAATRIQSCWRAYMTQCDAQASAAALKQVQALAALLRAAICIQRYARRRRARQHDRWRQVLVHVLQSELPRSRHAAEVIALCWRTYSARKQALLQQLDGLSGNARACGQDLATLRRLLLVQQAQAQREHAAAVRIQRMVWRRIDRRNGRLLLAKYRILMQRDVRKREQRRIIHSFLDEREKERLKRQQQQKDKEVAVAGKSTSSAGAAARSSASAAHSSDVHNAQEAGVQQEQQQVQELASDGGSGDDGDIQQFWSDEYQRAYTYNARTGESTWL